jgi:hypothetical protein
MVSLDNVSQAMSRCEVIAGYPWSLIRSSGS